MGFYLVLESPRSLIDVAKRLGAMCPCAVYFGPSTPVPPGEPNEVHAQGDYDLATVRIIITPDVEEEVRALLQNHFGGRPVKVFLLTYRDPTFFDKVASCILDDTSVWVVNEGGVDSGTAFLKQHLRSNS